MILQVIKSWYMILKLLTIKICLYFRASSVEMKVVMSAFNRNWYFGIFLSES